MPDDATTMDELRLLGLEDIIGNHETKPLIPVSRATWYRWVDEGIAPAPVKIGRRTFWRLSEVRRMAAGDRSCG